MATIPQYVTVMRNAQADICLRLGVDLAYSTNTERALAISNLAVQAVLIDLLVRKGVVTEAELLGAINAVRNSPWKPKPERPTPEDWDTTPVTGLPSPPPPVSGV
jgi:hypothetical protein